MKGRKIRPPSEEKVTRGLSWSESLDKQVKAEAGKREIPVTELVREFVEVGLAEKTYFDVIEKVNNILLDVSGEVSDVEHILKCHPEDVPDLLRRVAKGVLTAQEVVSEVILSKLEKL